MTALKVLELVDSEAHPDDKLEARTAEGEERRALLRNILEGFYRRFRTRFSRRAKANFVMHFEGLERKKAFDEKRSLFYTCAQAAGIKLSQRILAGRHGRKIT
ncbi:MAG: hypothetical protein Ct9H300mP19_06920 [Dehalococcoidia bacterium]|nr:MAG: hypothetical protein Ct9H300mP19_06920 [Dehalococcoidia bacterium]